MRMVVKLSPDEVKKALADHIAQQVGRPCTPEMVEPLISWDPINEGVEYDGFEADLTPKPLDLPPLTPQEFMPAPS